jgi:hypothetical protein
MWKTLLKDRDKPGGERDVILSRDGSPLAVIDLDEWWIMSANLYLANRALKANNLNFKAHEVQPPSQVENPEWTTSLVRNRDEQQVELLRGGAVIASMALNDWATLSATKYFVDYVVETAEGLAEYGHNIDEVDEAAAREEREMFGDCDDDEDEDEDEDEDSNKSR